MPKRFNEFSLDAQIGSWPKFRFWFTVECYANKEFKLIGIYKTVGWGAEPDNLIGNFDPRSLLLIETTIRTRCDFNELRQREVHLTTDHEKRGL